VFQRNYCDGMKKTALILFPLALTLLTLRALAESTPPEPGPVADGVRLRLLVTPNAEGGKEGYDVQVDLINAGRESIPLRACWGTLGGSGFKAYVEAATSIESDPAFEPCIGQGGYGGPGRTTPEPEYTLKPSETMSLKWHTTGRHLKNNVSNPLVVQNPEFRESGLYSVHASLVIGIAGRSAHIRSNEQLVPIGGSRELPKHSYGALLDAHQETKTATLSLGSQQKVVPGDRFLIRSGIIGMTWTLTITNVDAGLSIGTLEPSRADPPPAFPRRGWNAALIPKE
jgi:hypothetical protein